MASWIAAKYASLTGCTNCIPVKRRAEIDEINQERIDLGELLKNPVYTGGATTGGAVRRRRAAPSQTARRHPTGVTITHTIILHKLPRVLQGRGGCLLRIFLRQHPFNEQPIAHGGIIDEHMCESMMPKDPHIFGSRG